jgi:phosphoribosylglycinamide formyltransferase-1
MFGGGMDAIEQALESGLKFTGATVHIVTGQVDGGPILVQDSVPILEGDTVESLRRRVHEVEHRILPEGIRMMEARLAGRSSVR